MIYVGSPGLSKRLAAQWPSAYGLSLNKWYMDELYDAWIVKPTTEAADILWRGVDVAVIDAAVNGVARVVTFWSGMLRLLQSGQVQHYALAMALGAVAILGVYVLF